MPGKPRFCLPGVSVHIVQRGHSRNPVFFEADDYLSYLEWLKEASERYNCAIHAYVLMTNHVHILATPEERNGISLMMQFTGRHYVPYINHLYGSSGSIWEGRYKACLVDGMAYVLTCMRYIELNPVRAGMVRLPDAYRWCSYRTNALGEANDMIRPNEYYLRLGASADEITRAYRALFKSHLAKDQLDEIRAASQTGTPLGSDYFRKKVEARLRCKVGQSRRGRPVKGL